MIELVSKVYTTLQGADFLALLAAYIWGIFGMLLSPCSLVTIPLVVGYIESQETRGMKNAFVISSWFSLGIFVNVALVGIVIASAGSLLSEVGRYSNYFVATVFFLFGLHLLEVIDMPWFKQVGMKEYKHKGPLGALLLGALSGMAIGPCAFAYLAPMLVIAMKAATINPYFGLLLVLMYALGNCTVLVTAGTSVGFVSGFMELDEKSRFTLVMNYVFGVILLVTGLLLIYKAP